MSPDHSCLLLCVLPAKSGPSDQSQGFPARNLGQYDFSKWPRHSLGTGDGQIKASRQPALKRFGVSNPVYSCPRFYMRTLNGPAMLFNAG